MLQNNDCWNSWGLRKKIPMWGLTGIWSPCDFCRSSRVFTWCFCRFSVLFWSFQTLLFFFFSYFFLTIIFRNQSRGTLSMGFLWWKLEASRGLGFRCSHLSMEFLKPLVGFFPFFFLSIFFFYNSYRKLSEHNGKSMWSSLYSYESHRQRMLIAFVFPSPACCTPWPWS